MAYKTIVAHFNDERRAQALLHTSLRLARMHDAHLIGLAVLPPVIIVPGTEGDVGAVISDHREQYRPQVMRMRESFETAKSEAGVGGEWRELDAQDENPFGNVGTVALEHARCADLLIASDDLRAHVAAIYPVTATVFRLMSSDPGALISRSLHHVGMQLSEANS